VDLLLTLAGDRKITVDSTWTDYWTRKGEQSPPALPIASPEQARQLRGLLGRLERQAGEADGSAVIGEHSCRESEGDEMRKAKSLGYAGA
jgi:hypothetical protein